MGPATSFSKGSLTVTWYEVIITRPEHPTIVIEGLTELLASLAFLREAAQQGQIAGVTSVDLYDKVKVSGQLLAQLIQHLGSSHDWVDVTGEYSVYLSEV